MSKELFISSTPHQTKVALVENDQLSEVYFERENEYTLAGSIYKGRVTRVLPGMQSAFVDIGLERDAFLYVSDFFEMEDEDESFEPIPAAAKPFEVSPPAQRNEPVIFLNHEAKSAGEVEAEAEGEQESGEREESRSEGEGGGRRLRGRRRRRGRGRGFPDSKYARPESNNESAAAEEETPDETFDQPMYKPIILPGESLAKFRKTEEQQGGGGQNTAVEHVSEERAGEASRESRREDHPREERGGRGRDRGRRREWEGEEEPERPYAPIVLPGESISKYRNLQSQINEPQAAAPPATADDSTPQHEHEAVVTPEAAEDVRPEAKHEEEAWSLSHTTREGKLDSEVAQETIAAPEPTLHAQDEEPEQDEAISRASEVAQYHQNEEEREAEEHRETKDRYENVAADFGANDAEHPEQEEEEDAHGVEAQHEEEEVHELSAQAEETHEDSHQEPPNYQNAPVGAFEEEFVEADEEEDLPHPAEALYEPEDYEELEEETLEPMERAATELVEAIRETGAIEPIEGGYQGEENEDLDEIERAAYAEIGEPEAASAELRGPVGTAAFQQRTATRPEFDRHRRGRRGGRRPGRGGPRREQSRPQVLISEVLKEGQEVLIQIAKEPIGKKGARITSHIALPGRFLVYMPTVNHVGVSRKINSDEERMRLKRIVSSERENGHGGFIVRTAAAGISEEDLRNDIRFLKSLWHDIRTRADSRKSPALIYHDLNLVERTLRDLVTNDFTAIWVDTEQEYERVNRFVSRFQPGLVRRVKLYTKDTPLFEQFGLENEINKALKSKVWLKSGGYIVINQTEALVAIDINTGKYVGKTTRLEDTIFKTNVDAIKEIVRQIRLRDLGGIIVIDFIDMDERKNRQKVMQALEEEMKSDRAPSKVLQFNDFGLVAITRKRVKQSLERTLGAPCPYCAGNGFVKSPSTVCNEIYVEMRKMAKQFDGDILLRVNPEVAKQLKAESGRWLMEMEELTKHNIIVKSDPTLHQEQFDM